MLRQGVFSVEIWRNMEYYEIGTRCEEREEKELEGLIKLTPSNGKGVSVKEEYVNFNENEIKRILLEGVSDKNQFISFEMGEEIQNLNEGKVYDIVIEAVDLNNSGNSRTYLLKKVKIIRIDALLVHAMVVESVKK